jgi:hypothetical protein
MTGWWRVSVAKMDQMKARPWRWDICGEGGGVDWVQSIRFGSSHSCRSGVEVQVQVDWYPHRHHRDLKWLPLQKQTLQPRRSHQEDEDPSSSFPRHHTQPTPQPYPPTPHQHPPSLLTHRIIPTSTNDGLSLPDWSPRIVDGVRAGGLSTRRGL